MIVVAERSGFDGALGDDFTNRSTWMSMSKTAIATSETQNHGLA